MVGDQPATSARRERSGFAGRHYRHARTAWRRHRHAVTLPALAVATYLVSGWARRWTVDDAFINYRVVKHIEAGHGPVFNVGERVEVATSTAWLALLTIADVASPLRIEWTALVLQIALGCAGVAFGMVGALRLASLRAEQTQRGWVVPLGALAYAVPVGARDFATGGLENGLTMAWLGGAFWAVTAVVHRQAAGEEGPSRQTIAAAAVLVGAGMVIRPDFVPFCVGLGAPLVRVAWRRGGGWALARLAVTVGTLPVVVQVFRMGYYAQLVPNTVHAKSGTRAWWGQGWAYLSDFVGSYVLVVPVCAVVAWLALQWRADATSSPNRTGTADLARMRDWRVIVVGVELAAVAHALAVTRAGGDYMHARLLLPAWFALLLPVLAVRIGSDRAQLRRAIPLAVMTFWAIAALIALRPPAGSLFNDQIDDLSERELNRLGVEPGELRGILDARRAAVASTDNPHPVVLEDVLSPLHRPVSSSSQNWYDPTRHRPRHGLGLPVHPSIGTTVAPFFVLGAPGYATPLDVWVYDRLGLADPVVARAELAYRGTAGHEKLLDAPWIAAEFLDPGVVVRDPQAFAPVDPMAWTWTATGVGLDIDASTFASDRRAAAAALRCGELGELVHDVRAPLSPQRFLGNVVDAVRLHDVAVPVDPAEARERFCG